MSDLCDCKKCVALRDAIRSVAEQARTARQAHDVCKSAETDVGFMTLRELIIKTFKNQSEEMEQLAGLLESLMIEPSQEVIIQ